MGKASRHKRERRLAGGEQHSGEVGGFVGGVPVDEDLKPVKVAHIERAYGVREVSMAEMVSWKLQTPQPQPGAAGASEILRRVREEGQTLVMVQRGAGGIPEAVAWVCPGCGNTWVQELTGARWAREQGSSQLLLSLDQQLVCNEMTEGRCPSSPWTLRDGRLVGEEFPD